MLQVELKRLLGIYTNVRGGEGTTDDIEANRAGHKAWSALRSRMENQGLIETVVAVVNGRQTTCIRCGLQIRWLDLIHRYKPRLPVAGQCHWPLASHPL